MQHDFGPEFIDALCFHPTNEKSLMLITSAVQMKLLAAREENWTCLMLVYVL